MERHRPYGPYERYVKRPLDAVASFFVIILCFPVFLVIGLLVKIKLGSPVIFSQDRPGLRGKIFKLYKFRTMTQERGKTDSCFRTRTGLRILERCFGGALWMSCRNFLIY